MARAPVNALAMLQFSYETLQQGRADLAIEPARRAAMLYPGQAISQAVLGHVCLALGDSSAAAVAFEQ